MIFFVCLFVCLFVFIRVLSISTAHSSQVSVPFAVVVVFLLAFGFLIEKRI